MSRFMVEAEFLTVPAMERITGDMIARLREVLAIDGGSAFTRPLGWAAGVFVSMAPSPADAAHTAGDIIRKAARAAGLPPSVMTDVHARRVGGPGGTWLDDLERASLAAVEKKFAPAKHNHWTPDIRDDCPACQTSAPEHTHDAIDQAAAAQARES